MITVTEHLDLVNEAYYILCFMVNKDNLDEGLKRKASAYQKSKELYDKKSKYIKKIYNHVRDNLNSDREEIEYFFKKRGEEWVDYATLSLCWNPINLTYTLDNYEELISNQTEGEKYKAFVDIIEPNENVNLEKDKVYNVETLINYLEETSLESDVCFEIIKIYRNRKKYFDRVRKIMERAIKLLQDSKEEISFLENEFYQYWTKKQEEIDLNDLLEKQINVHWSHSKKGTIITMSIINFTTVTIALEYGQDMREEVISFGTMVDDNLSITRKDIEKDQVLKIGKVLADKSKIEILELISKKTAFGKEIASELNLSTATISYHMSVLVEIGFVKIEVISGRVYYHLDSDRIHENLDNLKLYFDNLQI
ncbi:ArsR/SmtB family transcription factor [Anaerosporobacter sp.]